MRCCAWKEGSIQYRELKGDNTSTIRGAGGREPHQHGGRPASNGALSVAGAAASAGGGSEGKDIRRHALRRRGLLALRRRGPLASPGHW